MKKKTGTRTHLSAQGMNPSHSTLSPRGHERETTHLWQCFFFFLFFFLRNGVIPVNNNNT